MRFPPAVQYLVKTAGAFALYFLAGELGLAVPFTSGNVSPVWPAAGVALALLLMLGTEVWPGIALGAFLVNYLSPIPGLAAVAVAIGNTGAAVVGAYGLLRLHLDHSLSRLRDVLLLVGAGAALSTMVAATVGSTTLYLTAVDPWRTWPTAWLIWWGGDAMGVLLVCPLLLGLRNLFFIIRRRKLEAAGLVVSVAASTLAVFGPEVRGATSLEVLPFVVFPFVVWAAISFRVPGSSAACCIIAAIAVWETSTGAGPFSRSSALQGAASMQAFLAVTSISGLIIGAIISERIGVQEVLRRERELVALREAAERELALNRDHLLRQQELVALAESAARLGYWEWNIATGEVIWSENTPALHGLQASDFDGTYEAWRRVIHPEDRALVEQAVADALAGKRQYEVEFRTLWPDGSVHWLAARADVLRNRQGEPERMVGIGLDVTHRRRIEEELKSQQDRLAGIIDSAMDAIISVDEDQRVVLFNRAAERIFGYSADQALGQPLDMFLPERYRQLHRQHIRSFGETGVTSRSMYRPGTLVGLKSSGEEFPLEATISQVVAGGQRLFTVILRDITERIQAEEALIRSEKLASAGRLAATIAHEINNPLEAVVNLLYLVGHSPELTPEHRTYLEAADLQLMRVAHIARQTLGFYRETAGPSHFQPAKILDEVFDLLRPKLEMKRVEVRRDYREAEVEAVSGEVRQIFANLLANALDALSSPGIIRVRVVPARDWADSKQQGVRVTISDNGAGIEPRQLGKIFEPFFTTKAQGGTGLGLWVVQQLVQRHGGRVAVRSRTRNPGRGTTFTVFLPRHHAAQELAQGAA